MNTLNEVICMDIESKMLLDTNIFVYAEDKKNPKIQEIAINFIDECTSKRIGVVSTQNLAEYSNVLLTYLKNISAREVNERINDISLNFELILYDQKVVMKANEYYEKFGTDFFDCLLVATMEENGIDTIVTRNVKHFDKIPWLKIINPFEGKNK